MYLLTAMLLLIRAELTDLLVVLSLSSKGCAISWRADYNTRR